MSGSGDDQELKIAFEQGGIRSFMAAYAPLKNCRQEGIDIWIKMIFIEKLKIYVMR